MQQRMDISREEIREGLTMALYLSLSLLAVMIALPEPEEGHEAADPGLLLALTALGLMAAHLVAFRISSRLTERGEVSRTSLRLIGAQLVGGLLVTVVAVLPVAIVRGLTGIRLSEVALLVFVSLVAYMTARIAAGSTRPRAIAYVLGVAVVVGVVLLIKSLAGH